MAEHDQIAITLPDGSVKRFDGTVTAATVAASIGTGLAKAAIAGKVDGNLVDLDLPIDQDARLEIITKKSDEALELIRHDCAHVLAEAVQDLYPGTQVTIGPAIDNGFYYDFARPDPFTPDDLDRIEKRMREIVSRGASFTREVWDRDDAIRFFEEKGEAYKAELIRDLPESEQIKIYRQGEWLDLCRGPHMPTTAHVGKAFKLMKVAGAYWRGDHRNEMLQRIYGTAWRDEKELAAYLHQLEEAERRDHRRLGREMGLFHQQEEATGAVFWHPKGWRLWMTIEQYVRRRLDAAGYSEIKTPQLIDRTLWEQSGHWEKFRENMFTVSADDGDRILAVKPMNCPAHVQVYKQGVTSYRDLPLRLSEFGSCHRNEPSGALHGIMRVRAFTQDDAHIFCTPEQINEESVAFCALLRSIYSDLGFDDVMVKFADRPPVRAGEDAVWDKAEAALKDAIDSAGLPYTMNPGEGAFYGPKLEFVLRDAIGRDWQCGTLQVDYVLPERLGAEYVGPDGNRHRPVMLHRAILGSMERFLGVMIEHFAGHLPLWLAPVQVVVTTITSDADSYAQDVAEVLKAAGIRVDVDVTSSKIGYKVREHSVRKVPVILAVGRREQEDRAVAIRRLGQSSQEVLALDDAVHRLKQEGMAPDLARAG